MKTKAIVIGIISLLILVAGGYYYSTVNAEFKEKSTAFIGKHILGETAEIVEPKIEKEIYAIADGTGSRYLNYAIPELDTLFIKNVLNAMYNQDGGKFWLSYIDRDSKNNQVLYIRIEPVKKTLKPVRKDGETSFSFSNRLKEWEQKIPGYRQDSARHLNQFIAERDKFINQALVMLKKVYTKGTSDNEWTDVVGSLNAAVSTVSRSASDTSESYIVCFSDMEQDAPYLSPKSVLNGIPSNIQVLAVNPVQGSSRMIADNILEIEHSDRLFEIMFNH
jgi:hypothetical protein